MPELSEVISPNGLMPCAVCNHIPGIARYMGDCGVYHYSPTCRCHKGVTPNRDRQAAIDQWNRTQDYEGYEWVKYFMRKCEAGVYGREFHEAPPEPWASKD